MNTDNLHNDKGGFKVPKDYFDTFEEKLMEKISQEDKSTTLLSDKESSGLKIPDDYFDTFEDRLMQKLNSNSEEVTKLPDNLKTGLTTPDAYFENIEATILQKTIHANKETKVISLFSRKNILYISGIAAMIAIIVSISINTDNDPLVFDTIDIADIQEYFDEGNAEFSDIEIAELLDDEANLADSFSDTQLSEEELENYLSDEELEDDIIYVE
ncbi:hypothetical protein [Aquimarina sp. 2201CG14-23]|uniref:hypothetical protein n=1 Tax=Aquimarina mycalae TaxID=3040073 RepID=UPI0024782855|nr:hypothetical protein [Aquimarina sp. 2201CG14-23]MDH7447207.1 hypothetical protein [Aquimarina sp. 2201CG14-23]